MRSILCFGDSNTWGYVPGSNCDRYSFTVRWTGLVQRMLGDDFRLIEEALNGRTSCFDDPFEDHRTGRKALPAILMSHAPLELVV